MQPADRADAGARRAPRRARARGVRPRDIARVTLVIACFMLLILLAVFLLAFIAYLFASS
ncbi:MAG: hypothetical protein SOI26_00100 [Coriobacteriales bacterium]